MVDSVGAIDLNNNNVPDELESYLTAKYVNKSDKTTLNDNELKLNQWWLRSYLF
jgi:OOP family OmpA-OmpF porin